jgi:DNA-binding transcriptional LysR family regulator
MLITNLRFPMDWEDLRYFHAVAREGSLAGAARTLGVNHSTVFRRINRLEDDLGVRLFERLREGYVLSVAGEDLRGAAERISDEVDDAGRRLLGRDAQLTGTLTLTTTDTLMNDYLGPHLAGFQRHYPEVTLEVLLDTQFLNLSKRQADVALRPTPNPPDVLVGRRLAGVAFAVYGAPGYLDAAGRGQPLGAYDWLGFDAALAHLAAADWMRKALPEAACRFRANNLMALLGAARAGMGLAALPCFMGDPEPGLERIEKLADAHGTALWILTHADLRNTARVRAFMDTVGDSIRANSAVLEGT